MTTTTERPTVFTVGLVMTGLLASLSLILMMLGAVFGVAVGGLAVLSGGKEAIPVGVALGAGVMVVVGYAMYQAFVLYACSRAWVGSRGWTIALIVLSAIGLLRFGCLSTPTQVLTIVGAALALSAQGRVVRAS